MFFRCGVGSSGTSLVIQIYTSSTVLYGQTITITKNGTIVGTTTFDNQGEAEYTVDESGTYTASVTLGGTTFTDTVEVTDTFDAQIEATPDGSTVTPVNDIQTWLHCANIWDKNYTTLSEVLADTTTLLALINSNNAVDYMVRSHDWCDDVCADATAMTYIGANNYAADTLLADSGTGNWLESICNSTYFESVLNVKVPTMTSNTTPSGVASASSSFGANYPAFKALDADVNTLWASVEDTSDQWVEYEFSSPVKLYKHYIKPAITISGSSSYTKTSQVSVQGYINGAWVDISEKTLVSNPTSSGGNTTPAEISGSMNNHTEITKVRVNFGQKVGVQRDCVYTFQVYGRADV